MRVRFFVAALFCYLAVTAGVLVSSGFLPYVTDNNESFSTLTHARNLIRYGLGATAGLTDEANSPDRAAHPYVYTHEGNFPRIPALGLLIFGINRVEWQITVLALLVGSLTTYLCYAVFSRIGGDVFAFLVVLVFSTDYLLYVQWQVNTFRVWHAFFLFTTLWVIQRINERNVRTLGAALLLNVMGLFYFEIVFALFVASFSLVYAAILHRSRPARLAWIAGATAAGAIASLGLLLAQLIAHFGLAGAWQDIRMTYLARSGGDASGGLEAHWQKLHFFLQQHIAYWDSASEATSGPGLLALVDALGHGLVKVYTPFLGFLGAIISVGLVLSGIGARRFVARLGRTISAGMIGRMLRDAGISRWWLVSGAIGAVLWAWVIMGPRFETPTPLGPWAGVLQGPGGSIGLQLIFGVSLVWGALLVWGNGWRYLRGQAAEAVRGAVKYLLCGSVAFVMTFVLFSTYVWNGYLSRYAPIPVFVADVWLALVLYVLLTIAGRTWRVMTNGRRAPVRHGGDRAEVSPARRVARAQAAALCATATVMTLVIAAYWVRLQATYAEKLPPTAILFMRHLAGSEFRHASFISDNYALPIAYFTEHWAYQDQTIPFNVSSSGGDGMALYASGKYIWFADRDSNPAYVRPQYYLCRINPTWEVAAALTALPPDGRLTNCSGQRLVRAAMQGTRAPFRNALVGWDPGAADMWAIVKLDSAIRLLPKD